MFSKVFQVENLNIIYVDMNDIITYKICTSDLTQWMDARIQELENSIAEKELSLGNVSGLCKYCRYQTRCYNDGNGLITKLLSIPKNIIRSVESFILCKFSFFLIKLTFWNTACKSVTTLSITHI
jgi:hypothetical protein